jgi:mutator protein MutT
MTDEVDRVQVYRYCPRCSSIRISIRPPRVDCGECGLTLYVNAAGAVGAILVDAEERVLLIRRAHEPAQGMLAFPGGFVDVGEAAEAALRREVEEEVGLTIETLEFLCSATNRYPFRGVIYATLDLFFVARLDSFTGARALDEVSAVEAIAAADLRPSDLAFDSMRIAWAKFVAPRASR